MPRDAPPGLYEAPGAIWCNAGPQRELSSTQFTLRLRVRDFALPTRNDHQIVSCCGIADFSPGNVFYAHSLVNGDYRWGWPRPRIYLDRNDQLQLDFTGFDQQVQEALGLGVRTFSLGRSITGADRFTPECFDQWVEVEGQKRAAPDLAVPGAGEDPGGLAALLRILSAAALRALAAAGLDRVVAGSTGRMSPTARSPYAWRAATSGSSSVWRPSCASWLPKARPTPWARTWISSAS